jgi:hypothetical protein
VLPVAVVALPIALLPLAVVAPPVTIIVRHHHAACLPAAPRHRCAPRLRAAPCRCCAARCRAAPCRCDPPQWLNLPPAAFASLRQPSPATVKTLLSRLSITFTTPVDGWLLRSLHTQQHTD